MILARILASLVHKHRCASLRAWDIEFPQAANVRPEGHGSCCPQA